MSTQPQQKTVSDSRTATEFRCDECGRRCTRGPDGTEYGHNRGQGGSGTTERCPNRPASVDPDGSSDPGHDGWVLPGGETVNQRPEEVSQE